MTVLIREWVMKTVRLPEKVVNDFCGWGVEGGWQTFCPWNFWRNVFCLNERVKSVNTAPSLWSRVFGWTWHILYMQVGCGSEIGSLEGGEGCWPWHNRWTLKAIFLGMSNSDSVSYSTCKTTMVSGDSFLVGALGTCPFLLPWVRESPVVGGMSLVSVDMGLQFLHLLI